MKKKIGLFLLYLCFLPPLLIYIILFADFAKIYPTLLTFLNLFANKKENLYCGRKNVLGELIINNKSIIYIYSKCFGVDELNALLQLMENKLFFPSTVNYTNNSSSLITFILNKTQEIAKKYRKTLPEEEKYITVLLTSDEHYYTYWKKNKKCILLTLTCNNNEIRILFDKNP